jgi:hypothetical protein
MQLPILHVQVVQLFQRGILLCIATVHLMSQFFEVYAHKSSEQRQQMLAWFDAALSQTQCLIK